MGATLSVWLDGPVASSLATQMRVTVCSKAIAADADPMWQIAGVYEALHGATGRLAADLAPELARGAEAMAARLTACRAHDTARVSADQALAWLRQLLRCCEGHPEATFHARVSAAG